MKKLLAVFAFLIPQLVFARALTVDTTQTGALNCTSNASSPTTVFTNDPAATRSYVINISSNPVYLGFQSTTSTSTPSAFSISLSSGNFSIPANSSSTIVFSPDGTNDVFTGPMWCVSGGTGSPIERIRMH